MFKETIIEALVAERKKQKLTQQDVAFRADWDVSFVSKIERGFGDRATSSYQHYMDALGVSAKVELIPKT